jgi:hypothetical protein
VHVFFLLARDFLLGNLGTQTVCGQGPGSDVRYRTFSLTTGVHARSK